MAFSPAALPWRRAALLRFLKAPTPAAWICRGRKSFPVWWISTFTEQAGAVLEAGANHLTHLYNAMPGIHHRNPGPIAAASERENVFAELICDGYHIHPGAVRMAFKLFPGRICLISDGLRCLGMPEGEYELGGQPILLKDGVARLLDGTIAGAASDLFTDLKNAISFGIPENEAILAATLNPARSIGMDRELGSIEPGKRADFVLCNPELQLQAVYMDGKMLE